ncbi:MAG: hypothetical protein ABR981_01815 [Candidatus Micrarchaeaceae archaeon]|jgi:hypothetical protein
MRLNIKKAQASIDLLISYGIAILIISIAMYVVLQLGIFNARLAPISCSAITSFLCSEYTINSNGIATIVFAQSSGGTMRINGASCSTEPNTISEGPEYGNVQVLPYSRTPQYYPPSNSNLETPLTVYPSNLTRFSINCYTASGIATGHLGNTYTGLVWINYTISNLPSSYSSVQQVISFTAKYS